VDSERVPKVTTDTRTGWAVRLRYFKITPGTGLKGVSTCRCPYCGFAADSSQFFTRDQIDYATSIAISHISDAVVEQLKKLEFNHPRRGPLGIGLSLSVEAGPSPPIRCYREKKLETEVICDRCTLRYAIYGVFAFCPDCGAHNSLQILNKNLELYEKLLALHSRWSRRRQTI